MPSTKHGDGDMASPRIALDEQSAGTAEDPLGTRKHRVLFELWRWSVILMLGWSVVTKAMAPKYLRGALRFDGFAEPLIPYVFMGVVGAELIVAALLFANSRSRWAPALTGALFSVFSTQLVVFLLAPGKYPGFCGCGLPTIWDGRIGLGVGLARNLLVLWGAVWAWQRFSRTGATLDPPSP